MPTATPQRLLCPILLLLCLQAGQARAGYYEAYPDLPHNRSWNLSFSLDRLPALRLRGQSSGPRYTLGLNLQKYFSRHFGLGCGLRLGQSSVRHEWLNGWAFYQASLHDFSAFILALARQPLNTWADVYGGVGLAASSLALEQKHSDLLGYRRQMNRMYPFGPALEGGAQVYLKNFMFSLTARYSRLKARIPGEALESLVFEAGGLSLGLKLGAAF